MLYCEALTKGRSAWVWGFTPEASNHRITKSGLSGTKSWPPLSGIRKFLTFWQTAIASVRSVLTVQWSSHHFHHRRLIATANVNTSTYSPPAHLLPSSLPPVLVHSRISVLVLIVAIIRNGSLTRSMSLGPAVRFWWCFFHGCKCKQAYLSFLLTLQIACGYMNMGKHMLTWHSSVQAIGGAGIWHSH